MGNIRQLAPGEVAPSGLPDVHGVAHRLNPADMAKLTDMEHEYRWPDYSLATVVENLLHIIGSSPSPLMRQRRPCASSTL